MAKTTLLISPDSIKNMVQFERNLDTDYMIAAIQLAQDKMLQPVIGTRLLESLQKKVESGEIYYEA